MKRKIIQLFVLLFVVTSAIHISSGHFSTILSEDSGVVLVEEEYEDDEDPNPPGKEEQPKEDDKFEEEMEGPKKDLEKEKPPKKDDKEKGPSKNGGSNPTPSSPPSRGSQPSVPSQGAPIEQPSPQTEEVEQELPIEDVEEEEVVEQERKEILFYEDRLETYLPDDLLKLKEAQSAEGDHRTLEQLKHMDVMVTKEDGMYYAMYRDDQDQIVKQRITKAEAVELGYEVESIERDEEKVNPVQTESSYQDALYKRLFGLVTVAVVLLILIIGTYIYYRRSIT